MAGSNLVFPILFVSRQRFFVGKTKAMDPSHCREGIFRFEVRRREGTNLTISRNK